MDPSVHLRQENRLLFCTIDSLLASLQQMLVSWLVGALSRVNHKGLHQGWTQTSLYLLVIHFTSHHTTSHVFFFIYFFIARLYSAGTQHGNLPLTGWPILFCGPAQEPCVSYSQHRKNFGRGFGKNAGEWTGSVEISKKESTPWQ